MPLSLAYHRSHIGRRKREGVQSAFGRAAAGFVTQRDYRQCSVLYAEKALALGKIRLYEGEI